MNGEWMLRGFMKYLAGVCVCILLAACSDSQAPLEAPKVRDPMADGAVRARVCMGCHGKNGISRVASYPSLAGLDKAYIESELHAFRSGTRENPMMNAMATNLSDEDIRLLAIYFSAQRRHEESR